MQDFPLSDNLMSVIFLVQGGLNEQQRERFVSSMNIRQIAMPQYTNLQVKQLFLGLDGRALVAGGLGGSSGGRFALCVIGVSSMFGGIIVLGTITVSGATGMAWAPGNGGCG